MNRVSSLFLSLVFVLCTSIISVAEPENIGVILPLSGEFAVFGQSVRKGVELAVAGSSQQFSFEDGEFDNKKALSAYHKLRASEGIKILIGPYGAAQTLAIAPVAEKDGVTIVAVSLCDSRFKNYNNIFCLYPDVSFQIEGTLDALEKKGSLKGKKIGMMLMEYETRIQAEKTMQDFAERNSMEVVFREIITAGGSMDYRTELMRAEKMDLFYVFGGPEITLQVLKNMRQLKIDPEYVVLSTDISEDMIAANAELLEGVYFPGWFDELGKTFSDSYKEKYKAKADLYGALGYDAAQAVLSVVKSINKKEVTSVDEGLLKLKLQDPACKGFAFKPDRTIHLNLVSRMIKSGKFAPLD